MEASDADGQRGLQQRADALWANIFRFDMTAIRMFHLAWSTFFVSFFAWFGIAPLMPVIRDELRLTPDQVGWCLIASVMATVLGRPLIGWACDRYGARKSYGWLMVLGALPIGLIGLARDFETLLAFRFLIGIIGSSFVITQYHTTFMFTSRCVGSATATSAGWGNLGGGVTQFAMPLLFAFFVGWIGLSQAASWRLCMVAAGAMCALMGLLYFRYGVDRLPGDEAASSGKTAGADARFDEAESELGLRDHRVWLLALAYGGCFGIELTIKGIAAMYFVDYFGLGLQAAGFAAGAYGLMNLFARPLGGTISDAAAKRWGLGGRIHWLFVALFCEGLALFLLSQAKLVWVAIASLIILGLFVQMSSGACYVIAPFLSRKKLGLISGIVGAGGNFAAVLAGFLFKGAMPWPTTILVLGVIVTLIAFAALALQPRTATQRQPQLRAKPIPGAADFAA